MAARNGTLGARAAVYRGAAVLVGAEDGAARNGILGARAAVYRGAAVLSGAEEGGERRRSGPHRRNLATPTPEGGEQANERTNERTSERPNNFVNR